MADVIGSKEFARFFEVATFVGYEIRGTPDGIEAPNGSYRWGTGVALPSRSPLRLCEEVNRDPEHANAHEETRRLNRRVALVVRLQP